MSREKSFDAVAVMRAAREAVRKETKGMRFEELRAYLDTKTSAFEKARGRGGADAPAVEETGTAS